jgi:hypothetical protein
MPAVRTAGIKPAARYTHTQTALVIREMAGVQLLLGWEIAATRGSLGKTSGRVDYLAPEAESAYRSQ